jgi:deoxyribodipyrimidine photo-lyase
MSAAVVWFKRDLRVSDHAPLRAAAASGPVVALYVYEPDIVGAPDYAPQHLEFANECLEDLDARLAALGIPLVRRRGSLPAVLADLRREVRFDTLWSHEETGNGATYARDRSVARWCRAEGVRWTELPGNAVVRRLADRDRWTALWHARMAPDPVAPPDSIAGVGHRLASCGPLAAAELGLAGRDKPMRHRGGRAAAMGLLSSFLDGRAAGYRAGMSSPLTADRACSRLSPYLAWGVLSVREVVHALRSARGRWAAMRPAERPPGILADLSAFDARLHWHCHFAQKLESQPDIEFHNLHRGYDGLRDGVDRARHESWCRGETGVPMIDACMRMLRDTGWINFRMRAMLVSFSSYHLWHDWREPALHLAREFLDYDPGIHYPQVQMQSGTTGINAFRIYNPTKQAADQDPDGAFIRHWCPELAQVPLPWLAEPWRMPAAAQRDSGCRIGIDYPVPVVDVAAAGKAARDRMYAARGGQRRIPTLREHTADIVERHASRKRPTRRAARATGRRAEDAGAGPQIALFVEPSDD